MQFIEFKKEHFKDDEIYEDADYEIKDDPVKVIIRMKKPADIRVNF